MTYKNPALAVDCVVFNENGDLLLIKRKNFPYQGHYALPGGFVEYGESTELAAERELREETNLEADKLDLIGIYSDPCRDPRQHVVSVAYKITCIGYDPEAGDDASHAEFISDWKNLDLAFDHNQIVMDAIKMQA